MSAGSAKESKFPNPNHVERGENRGKREHREYRRILRHRQIENRVLGEKAREKGHADDRRHTDRERPESERHLLLQPAHLENILLMMAAVDHRSRTEEHERFEARVRRQMEHCGADTRSNHHFVDGSVVIVNSCEGTKSECCHHVAEL